LVKVIDNVSDVEIQEVNLPRGIPVVYNFDQKWKSQPAGKKLSQLYTNAVFLEKPGLLEEALKQQEKWRAMVPGLDEDKVGMQVTRDQPMVHALEQLRAEQKAEVAITLSGEFLTKAKKDESSTWNIDGPERWDDDSSEFEDWDEFSDNDSGDSTGSSFFNLVPATGQGGNTIRPAFKEDDPVVVFIRHGRTSHNNLGRTCRFSPPFGHWKP
jgi:hypothetical protein